MAGTSEFAVNTAGAAPAPAAAPAYDAETQAFIKQIDDYAAEMGGKGYAVNKQAVVGPDGADPYKALIAARTDPKSLVDVGFALKTNKGNPAKVKNNPTGTIYANPNYQYRITNEAGKNKVLYTGTGLEGLQNVYTIAQELSQKGGKKANWGVEQFDPSTGQWQRVADDDPAKNTLGKIAGLALPVLGAFAFPGLGILGGALGSAAGAASGSVASGVLQGKSLGSILKNAAITGGLSFAGGSLLGGAGAGGAGGTAASGASGASGGLGAAGAGATGSALGSAAGDIVVNGIRNVLPGAFGGAAGAAAGSAAAGALSGGGSGSTPQTVDEILVEANKPLVNPSGVLDAATLASLGIPASVSGGKPMTLSDVANYLKIASLGVGVVGNMFGGGGGGGSQGTMPGPIGTTAPIFGAKLPTTSTVFGSNGAPTPRKIGPYDWKTYGQRPELSFFSNVPQRFAKGGLAVKRGGRAVEGSGTGRSDSIPAELSDGEYVIDAETVALLGDGSSKAGAKALDAFRVNVRKHKGRKLAKGEFSVKAKRAERYLKEGTR